MSKTVMVCALFLALGASGLTAQQQPQLTAPINTPPGHRGHGRSTLRHGVTQPTLTAPIDRLPGQGGRDQTALGTGIRPAVDMSSPKLRGAGAGYGFKMDARRARGRARAHPRGRR